ncbi:MAG: regulatory protein RecX [Oscillospiraceae bacterium]|nr:regulatory protein RecX [Oscillospiraceae bacterium]
MRIDSISPNPDRMGRHLVKCGTEALKLYRQTIQDFGLYPGLELTAEQERALRESVGEMSAKMRAVRIISASSVSRRDLEQRLIRKGEDVTQARAAVEWLEELELVDDSKTAQTIVRQCVYKGYGPARAKQALYEKQIPKHLWDEVLADYPDQTEHIIKTLRTKLPDPADERQKRRVIDGLLRRGHSYGAIRRAMEQMGDEWDEYSEDE